MGSHMYQDQFVSLTQQLQLQTKTRFSLNRLLNDDELRRKLIQQAVQSGDSKLQSLARKITVLEDLMPYRICIDLIPEGSAITAEKWRRLGLLTVFALSNLSLIVGAVVAYEDIKEQRQQAQQMVTVN